MMEKVIMYEQIYRDLQNAIREKEYKAGERLPSEKELEENSRSKSAKLRVFERR